MPSKFPPSALRYSVKPVFLATVFFVSLQAASAQINVRAVAKPILLAEWTGQTGDLTQIKLPQETAQASEKSRIVARTKLGQILTARETKRFIDNPRGGFASLKPTALEEQAFALVNEQRLLQHLSPLVWDLEMLYLAREHSESMARLNFFSHRGIDGKMADDRANEIGVNDWRGIGENIAFNQGIENRVEAAVQSWTNSQHHKANLLDQRWTRTGIGIAQTPEGKFYITQVFRD